MELKNLLTRLKHKEEAPEQFFALEISDDIVKSAVWTVIDGHTKVVKIGSPQSWDGQSEDSLLKAADQSISQASENLEPEPSGVVFGLPESWLDKDKINPDKKKFLKTVCEQLELKPLGYVVTDNAVIQYFKIEEGTPPSAIFLKLSSTELNLTLVKLGKTIGTQLVGRSEDLGPDVEEGLSRFDKIDTLPSRMILYNGKRDFEEDKQQLISYDWEEKLPFIHFPKVEVLPMDISIKAVALAGGSEVAKSLGFDIKPPVKKNQPASPAIANQSSEASSQAVTAESLGFSDQDVVKVSPPDTPSVPVTAEPIASFQSVSEPTAEPLLSDQPSIIIKLQALLQSTQQLLQSGFNRLKSIFNFKGKNRPKALTLIGIGVGLIFIGLLSAYWYLPKAKITIYVEPKIVDEELSLIIDPQAVTLDSEAGILPGKTVDISAEGSQQVSTTGTALVGDPAEGDIAIYNKTNDKKTFAVGTVLIGPDNLAFALDDEVTVASRSSEEDSDGVITITPGKTQAKITAKSIGPESNLSADTKLAFQKFSEDDYYAKVAGGLSGGTAREVKAVSSQDQANLLEALTKELKAQAAEDLKAQLGEGMSLVDIEDQDEVISKSFNHDVDEEADTLKLDAKLEYQALSYRQGDLDLLLQQTIKEKIPDNFQLSQSSQIEVEPAELHQDNTAAVNVIFKAKLIPKLDFGEIKAKLKGRYPQITQEYLATLPSFIKADIVITPNLPAKLKTLPRLTKNITLEIKPQD